MFALVDCNNFYASCERLFRPELEGVPIVVLSNNDGCIIARSNEAKALGVQMGEPYFKAAPRLKAMGVQVFSSNYALYGDLSGRVMRVLEHFSPTVEVYSIDEAFLDFSGFEDPLARAETLRDTVKRWVGIPVAVGVAPTKTLAKVAAKQAKGKRAAKQAKIEVAAKQTKIKVAAKQTKQEAGACVLTDVDAALAAMDAGDVWGIGRRWARMLKSHGIYTARDFRDARPAWVRKRMGVVGARVQAELQGHACFTLEEQPPDKQTIRVSRSFAGTLKALEPLREALAAFASRAAEKLRDKGLVAEGLHVFAYTDRFNDRAAQFNAAAALALPRPTDHTGAIVATALKALDRAFRPGFGYKKAGVMLVGLSRENAAQEFLFAPTDDDPERARALMAAFDRINAGGRHLLHYGSLGLPRKTGLKEKGAGVEPNWWVRRDHRSPSYTTDWDSLPSVGG